MWKGSENDQKAENGKSGNKPSVVDDAISSSPEPGEISIPSAKVFPPRGKERLSEKFSAKQGASRKPGEFYRGHDCRRDRRGGAAGATHIRLGDGSSRKSYSSRDCSRDSRGYRRRRESSFLASCASDGAYKCDDQMGRLRSPAPRRRESRDRVKKDVSRGSSRDCSYSDRSRSKIELCDVTRANRGDHKSEHRSEDKVDRLRCRYSSPPSSSRRGGDRSSGDCRSQGRKSPDRPRSGEQISENHRSPVRKSQVGSIGHAPPRPDAGRGCDPDHGHALRAPAGKSNPSSPKRPETEGVSPALGGVSPVLSSAVAGAATAKEGQAPIAPTKKRLAFGQGMANGFKKPSPVATEKVLKPAASEEWKDQWWLPGTIGGMVEWPLPQPTGSQPSDAGWSQSTTDVTSLGSNLSALKRKRLPAAYDKSLPAAKKKSRGKNSGDAARTGDDHADEIRNDKDAWAALGDGNGKLPLEAADIDAMAEAAVEEVTDSIIDSYLAGGIFALAAGAARTTASKPVTDLGTDTDSTPLSVLLTTGAANSSSVPTAVVTAGDQRHCDRNQLSIGRASRKRSQSRTSARLPPRSRSPPFRHRGHTPNHDRRNCRSRSRSKEDYHRRRAYRSRSRDRGEQQHREDRNRGWGCKDTDRLQDRDERPNGCRGEEHRRRVRSKGGGGSGGGSGRGRGGGDDGEGDRGCYRRQRKDRSRTHGMEADRRT